MANIALVVIDKTAPSSGDAAIKSTLEGGGHTVTYVSDEDSVLAGQDLHFITESGTPTNLGTKYQNLSTPVVSLEVGGWDDQLWCDGNGTNGGSTTDMDLLAHAITSGLSDPLTVFSTNGGCYGIDTTLRTMGAGIEVFAHHGTVSTTNSGFCYDTGSALVGGTNANARQVGIGIVDSRASAAMASGGAQLVLNAVTWALGGAVTGTAALTDQPDTVAASGQLGYPGTVAIAEGGDIVAAEGGIPLPITGTAALTDAPDVVSATGQLGYAGTVAVPEAPDSVVAVGTNFNVPPRDLTILDTDPPYVNWVFSKPSKDELTSTEPETSYAFGVPEDAWVVSAPTT